MRLMRPLIFPRPTDSNSAERTESWPENAPTPKEWPPSQGRNVS